MTASELKHGYETNNSPAYFFERGTMKFFGDTMRNYGVTADNIEDPATGEVIPVWRLYRKRPVKHGLKGSRFFTRDTFQLLTFMVAE